MRRAAAVLAVVCALGCGVSEPEGRAMGSTMEDSDVASVRQPLRVCAGPATVPGIDVSEYQRSVDWGQVAAAGYKFAIARINDGHHHDPYFAGNWNGIKQAGLIRGAYQYYEPTIDSTTQANWVINAVGALGPGDLPVVLDVEWTTGTPNAAAIDSWVRQVTAGTGKVPMVYTALGYWNQYFTTEFGHLDLWVANYGPPCPNLPSSWNHWLFWQWGVAPTPGIAGNVDQNVFNGSLDQLRIVAGQNANSGCTGGQQLACSHYGCGCAEGQCSGGFCPGTGCSQAQRSACGAFGCNCVDQQCNGGFCPGAGCTAKETQDCGNFGCNCVDHQCSGGFCAGTGCTARETLDCGNYGCGCVDHACSGGFCPGSGCTARQTLDCEGQGGACKNAVCTLPTDAGVPTPDAGPGHDDAGTAADAGIGEDAGATFDAGTVDPREVEPGSGGGGGGDVRPGEAPMVPVIGGCSTGSGVAPLLLLLGLLRRPRRQRSNDGGP